jgi:hypothetical protein
VSYFFGISTEVWLGYQGNAYVMLNPEPSKQCGGLWPEEWQRRVAGVWWFGVEGRRALTMRKTQGVRPQSGIVKRCSLLSRIPY